LLGLQIEKRSLAGEEFFRSVQPDVPDEEDIAGVGVVIGVIAVDAVIAVMDLNVSGDSDTASKRC
jgi:hypothetical protein